jgi:hypothetical protein
LQRRRANLILGHWRIEIEESPDVSAHEGHPGPMILESSGPEWPKEPTRAPTLANGTLSPVKAGEHLNVPASTECR